MITGPGIRMFGISPTKTSGVLPSSIGTLGSPSVSPGRSGNPFSTCDGMVSKTALMKFIASAIAFSSHDVLAFIVFDILRHFTNPSSSLDTKPCNCFVTFDKFSSSAW